MVSFQSHCVLALYTALMSSTAFVWRLLWKVRSWEGKEDPKRLKERRGITQIERPKGPLVWVHVASIGEARSALGWIDTVLKEYPNSHVLLTSQTLSAYKALEKTLPDRVIHQMMPGDVPAYVNLFLAHWRPNILCVIESEIWPLAFYKTHLAGIPLWSLNARLSEKSLQRWKPFSFLLRDLYGLFDLCVTGCRASFQRISLFLGNKVEHGVSLKYSSPVLKSLPADALQNSLKNRQFWLVSCMHAEEEDFFLDTARTLKKRFPKLLWVVVPRHMDTVEGFIQKAAPLTCQRRSSGEALAPDTDVFIVDTFGELALFYPCTDFVVMGGTFADIGGRNLIEPALFRCGVIHGPDMLNNQDIADDFKGAALSVTKDTLADTVASLLETPEKAHALGQKAYDTAVVQQQKVQALLQRLSRDVGAFL